MGSGPGSMERGRRARARIVDAACALFHERGIAATGLADIAEASGTGKGQLYHYFSGKTDLALTVVVTQTARILRAQEDLLETMSTPADLRAWADHAVAAHAGSASPRCPLGALATEVGDMPALRDELDRSFAAWRGALGDGLARLAAGGHLAPGDPADHAESLLCAYEGGVLMSGLRGDVRPLRVALDAAVRAALGPGDCGGAGGRPS